MIDFNCKILGHSRRNCNCHYDSLAFIIIQCWSSAAVQPKIRKIPWAHNNFELEVVAVVKNKLQSEHPI